MIIDLRNTSLKSLKRENYTFKDLNIEKQFEIGSALINRDSLDHGAIQNSLRNLFTYRVGERPLKPEYGHTLYKYLYEPINDFTTDDIQTEVGYLIKKWEPRVIVDAVDVIPNEDQQTYEIRITYSVPALDKQLLTFRTSLTTSETTTSIGF